MTASHETICAVLSAGARERTGVGVGDLDREADALERFLGDEQEGATAALRAWMDGLASRPTETPRFGVLEYVVLLGVVRCDPLLTGTELDDDRPRAAAARHAANSWSESASRLTRSAIFGGFTGGPPARKGRIDAMVGDRPTREIEDIVGSRYGTSLAHPVNDVMAIAIGFRRRRVARGHGAGGRPCRPHGPFRYGLGGRLDAVSRPLAPVHPYPHVTREAGLEAAGPLMRCFLRSRYAGAHRAGARPAPSRRLGEPESRDRSRLRPRLPDVFDRSRPPAAPDGSAVLRGDLLYLPIGFSGIMWPA